MHYCNHPWGLLLFYSKVTGGQAKGDCELCDLGHYCNGTARTEVSAPCDPGYFCLRGAKIPKPNNDSTGGICPRGSYCEAGKQPEKCQPGISLNYFHGLTLFPGRHCSFGCCLLYSEGCGGKCSEAKVALEI